MDRADRRKALQPIIRTLFTKTPAPIAERLSEMLADAIEHLLATEIGELESLADPDCITVLIVPVPLKPKES